MAHNYFRATPHMATHRDTGSLHFFVDEDTESLRSAYDQAVLKGGPRAVISVYRMPTQRGPWETARIIGENR